MRPNKKLFYAVLARVEKFCGYEGFVAHPVYVPAWEPTNQCYQASLIRSDVSKFVDQLEISLYPSWAAFRFSASRYENSFDFKTISDLPEDAGDWTELQFSRPHLKFDLLSGNRWNVLSHHLDFKVSKRKPIIVDAEANRVCTAFERNAVYLFGALAGDYDGRFVHTGKGGPIDSS